MQNISENQIEEYLTEQVKINGGEVRKLSWVNRRHAPDRLVMLPYFHPYVELKKPGEEPTDGQLREHQRMRRYGFTVYVIDTYEGVAKMLADYRKWLQTRNDR